MYEDGWEGILAEKLVPRFTDDWPEVGVSGALISLKLNTLPFDVAFDIYAQAEGSDEEVSVAKLAVKANSHPHLLGATPKEYLTWDNVGESRWRLILKPSQKLASLRPGISRYYGRQYVTEWLAFEKSDRFEANKKMMTREERQGRGGKIKSDKPVDLDILGRRLKGDNPQTWPLPDGFDLGWSEENGGTLRINPDSNVRMLWLPDANASLVEAKAETVTRLSELADSTTSEIIPPTGKRTLVAVRSSEGKVYFVMVKKVNTQWANLSWYEPEPRNVKTDLPPDLLEKRNKLLADAQTEIQTGLIELSKQFPHLKKAPDWHQQTTKAPGSGPIEISLAYPKQMKSAPSPSPYNYRVFVMVLPPSSMVGRGQGAGILLSLYPNLKLGGGVGIGAENHELKVALIKLVNNAVEPLKKLEESLAKPESADTGKKLLLPGSRINIKKNGSLK